MEKLRDAIAELEAFPEGVHLRELSSLIDRLQALQASVARQGVKNGDHLLEGRTPCGWVASSCRVSSTSAVDRLRVGEQLEKMPRLESALRSGEIGYQATSLICHLSELVSGKVEFDPEEWIGWARQFSIKDLRRLCEHARYVIDPDGAERDSEEDYERRYLHLSEFGRMFKLDALLDRECGMALKTALEALTQRLGPTDDRAPKQRRADAFKEIVIHRLDEGRLPKRNGVRPHVSLHVSLEGGAAELAEGMPVTQKTAQRLACDAAMHRVVKAESRVIDVGRAKRTAQPAQWRAIKARYRTCAAPGCERPLGWTRAHHVEFWSHGGETNARKLVPLCYYHHRLVHEGGWQVVLAGERVEFIPPDTPAMTRRRWGEYRRAA